MSSIERITFFNQKLHYFTQCASTQEEAKKYMGKANTPFVVFTEYQSDGKGQRGTIWDAESKKNILMTLAFPNIDLSIEKLPFINIATSILLYESLSNLNVDLNIKIKWPNDLFLNRKKVSGILIDSTISDNNVKNIYIGIGINVNQDKFNILTATSLKNELKKEVDRTDFLKIILQKFEHNFSNYISQSPIELMKGFNKTLLHYSDFITIIHQDKKKYVKNLGISTNGAINFYDFGTNEKFTFISPKEFQWDLQ